MSDGSDHRGRQFAVRYGVGALYRQLCYVEALSAEVDAVDVVVLHAAVESLVAIARDSDLQFTREEVPAAA